MKEVSNWMLECMKDKKKREADFWASPQLSPINMKYRSSTKINSISQKLGMWINIWSVILYQPKAEGMIKEFNQWNDQWNENHIQEPPEMQKYMETHKPPNILLTLITETACPTKDIPANAGFYNSHREKA